MFTLVAANHKKGWDTNNPISTYYIIASVGMVQVPYKQIPLIMLSVHAMYSWRGSGKCFPLKGWLISLNEHDTWFLDTLSMLL